MASLGNSLDGGDDDAWVNDDFVDGEDVALPGEDEDDIYDYDEDEDGDDSNRDAVDKSRYSKEQSGAKRKRQNEVDENNKREEKGQKKEDEKEEHWDKSQPDQDSATLEFRLRNLCAVMKDGVDDVFECKAYNTMVDALLLLRAPGESDALYKERQDEAIAQVMRAVAVDDSVREHLRQLQAIRRAVPQYVPRVETTEQFRQRLNRETDYHTFDEATRDMAQRCFLRPDYREPTDANEDITFMIMDMDHTNTLTNRWDVLTRTGARTDDDGNEIKPSYWSFYVRLFGVTKEGLSVCAYVNGFAPYVYVQVPSRWQQVDCQRFVAHLDRTGQPHLRYFTSSVANYELCERKNVYGYTKDVPIKMMKIAFHNASGRRRFIEYIGGKYEYISVRDAVSGEMKTEKRFKPGKRDAGMPGGHEFWLFDANVTPRMQFVNNTKILPSHWVTLRANTYQRHNPPMIEAHERRTRCQIDVDTDFDCVVVDASRSDIAPFLVESWDIECVRGARDDKFPIATIPGDEIIQIGSTVWRFGDEDNCYQTVHCVRPTAKIDFSVDWDVFSYKDEKSMLKGYMQYSRDHVDADARIAFNQFGFDNPYWDTRNKRHFPYRGGGASGSKFDKGDVEYGRVTGKRSECRETFSGSKAHGGRTMHVIKSEGRIDLDVFKHAAEQWKLPRGLNFIAEKIVGAKKDDIDYRQINANHDAGAFERGETAKYCRVDTELPLKIIRKREVLVQMIEQSRLCGVPLQDIFNKKMMARVFALISRETHDAGYALPEKPERFVKDPRLREMMFGNTSPEGAIVLPPQRDFYDQPICTLDFASLYPSIMRAFKLCYTTLILDPNWLEDPETTFVCLEIRNPHKPEEEPFKAYWATNVKEPLIYRVLTKLLAARSAAKKAMFAAAEKGDKFYETLYNAKQEALKVICNSVYGFTGASVGPLPCMAITAAVTWYGRKMIMQTKEYVEQHVPGSEIIYGDTDSVMIKFNRGNDDAAFRAAFTVGKQMAAEVTKLFPPEVKLEFEKVFMPYILWGKKTYAGILFTDPDKPGEYKRKGIASVRGDKIRFVTRLTDALVKQMIKDKSTDGAKQMLHDQLSKLVNNELPVEDFVIEKKLAKETDMYHSTSESSASLKPKEKKTPEHVQVADEMQRRCPGQAPKAGSIVSYVLAFDEEKQRMVPVDVAWFKANPKRFRVHNEHYLTNLIHETIGKLIDLPRFDPDPYRLFEPYIARAVSHNMGADITKFAQKTKRDDVVFANADAVGNRLYSSKMKLARLKKEQERQIKDDAKAAGRDYKSFAEGAAITSFVKKRAQPEFQHLGQPMPSSMIKKAKKGNGK